jgi:hypothetical protein
VEEAFGWCITAKLNEARVFKSLREKVTRNIEQQRAFELFSPHLCPVEVKVIDLCAFYSNPYRRPC